MYAHARVDVAVLVGQPPDRVRRLLGPGRRGEEVVRRGAGGLEVQALHRADAAVGPERQEHERHRRAVARVSPLLFSQSARPQPCSSPMSFIVLDDRRGTRRRRACPRSPRSSTWPSRRRTPALVPWNEQPVVGRLAVVRRRSWRRAGRAGSGSRRDQRGQHDAHQRRRSRRPTAPSVRPGRRRGGPTGDAGPRWRCGPRRRGTRAEVADDERADLVDADEGQQVAGQVHERQQPGVPQVALRPDAGPGPEHDGHEAEEDPGAPAADDAAEQPDGGQREDQDQSIHAAYGNSICQYESGSPFGALPTGRRS